MISILKGKVLQKTPTSLVIDSRGIGFMVYVPVPVSKRTEVGKTTSILIQSIFSRNGLELYGFEKEEEREVFNTLLKIKGVGPRAGLNLLSRLGPQEIKTAIANEDLEIFQTIPGIGPKKAEKIIRHLRKIIEEGTKLPEAARELFQALLNLGFSRQEITSRLSQISNWSEKPLSEVIELILKQQNEQK
jgi:Holliday junction DNA helicase RuvA